MTDKLTPTAEGTSPLATVAMACSCPGRSCVASRHAASWAKAALTSGNGSTKSRYPGPRESLLRPESSRTAPGSNGLDPAGTYRAQYAAADVRPLPPSAERLRGAHSARLALASLSQAPGLRFTFA